MQADGQLLFSLFVCLFILTTRIQRHTQSLTPAFMVVRGLELWSMAHWVYRGISNQPHTNIHKYVYIVHVYSVSDVITLCCALICKLASYEELLGGALWWRVVSFLLCSCSWPRLLWSLCVLASRPHIALDQSAPEEAFRSSNAVVRAFLTPPPPPQIYPSCSPAPLSCPQQNPGRFQHSSSTYG